MLEKSEAKPVRRLIVDDAPIKILREKEKSLRDGLLGKTVSDLDQSELVELILLLASQAGLVDEQGKVI